MGRQKKAGGGFRCGWKMRFFPCKVSDLLPSKVDVSIPCPRWPLRCSMCRMCVFFGLCVQLSSSPCMGGMFEWSPSRLLVCCRHTEAYLTMCSAGEGSVVRRLVAKAGTLAVC